MASDWIIIIALVSLLGIVALYFRSVSPEPPEQRRKGGSGCKSARGTTPGH